MDLNEIRVLVASRLPERYEPLQITFYGERAQPLADYVVIGDDYGTELRVRLSDGAVLSINPEGVLPTRFVNTSIERLAEFIEIHQSHRGRAEGDEEVAPLARQLRDRLAILDPKAFSDPENWWAVVLEQTEDGLL